MKFHHTLNTSIIGLKTNKSRSALTILGIVIGIMAIMIVVSLGQAAQNLILGQIQSIGAKTIAVVPGRQPTGPTDFISTFTDSLKAKDLEDLQKKSNAPYIEKIMPIVFGSTVVSYSNKVYRPTIYGLNSYFEDIYNISMDSGRNFTEDEVRTYSDVAVIGHKAAEKLFDTQNPVGLKVKIKDKTFRIIGLMSQKGQSSFLNFDDVVIIPYTTGQRYIFGIKHFNRLAVEADTEDHVDETVRDITLTLRANHSITDPTKDDFYVQTQADALNTVKTITDVLTVFLAAVAAISLLVGGIGIMNIMLVSVTERTREIGLRKALGATNRNILTQFLLEAVVLTGMGGVIGIALGTFFSLIVSFGLSQYAQVVWTFSFPIGATILGLLVSTVIGLVFGLYPARQAAKKSPIEALRFE
jgi:putative ABC transport system permease protein